MQPYTYYVLIIFNSEPLVGWFYPVNLCSLVLRNLLWRILKKLWDMFIPKIWLVIGTYSSCVFACSYTYSVCSFWYIYTTFVPSDTYTQYVLICPLVPLILACTFVWMPVCLLPYLSSYMIYFVIFVLTFWYVYSILCSIFFKG